MHITHEELQAAEVLMMLAITEDVGRGDVTSQALLEQDITAEGRLVARQNLVVCGVPIAARLAERYGLSFLPAAEDGEVRAHGTLATLTGSARKMLTVERVMLNFMQRMSAVATCTHTYVDAVAGTQTRILDTRKTIPGWRMLDKYAVRAGGGVNHRMGLFDALMIKDNHIAIAGGLTAAVTRAVDAALDLPIIVECDTLAQVEEAVSLPVSRLLLDNMDIPTLTQAVRMVAGRVPLEASGGVRVATVRAIADTGVDYISVGAITHSAPAVDIGLDIILQGP